MKIGIIGLPLVGKTTLFNLLTQAEAETSKFYSGRTEANHGMARVPDERIDWLSAQFKPRKTIYAQIEVTDLPGLTHNVEGGSGNPFLANIRTVDALVHVVRAFGGDEIEHVEGNLNPVRDIDSVNSELLLADLDLIERRIERIKTGKKVIPEQKIEMDALQKCYEALEKELPLTTVTLSEAEAATLQHYEFFTEKPQLVVINVDEAQFKANDYPQKQQIEAMLQEKGIPVLVLCAQTEREIAELPAEDRELFMADLGVDHPGTYRLARSMYDLLGLIAFFTVGEDEVRAWTIKKGLDAKRASGKIHSDLERGFIRAEVVSYDALREHGTMAKCKEKGVFRLEGKDYIVKDGDILNIRFNV